MTFARKKKGAPLLSQNSSPGDAGLGTGEFTSRSGSSRDGSLDLLRGFAIALVVLFHAATVLRADYPVPLWLETVNAVFAPVRMPSMVFLSGLLVAPSLRKGVKPYLLGKVRRVAWPYLVWSIGFVLLLAVAAPAKNSWTRIFTIPFDPVEHLWFLYYLFAFYVLAVATRFIRAEFIAIVMMLISVVAIPVGWYDLQVFSFLGAFFFAGAALSRAPRFLEQMARSRWVMVLSILSFAGTVALGVTAGEVRYLWFLTPIVFFIIVGAITFARRLAPHQWTAPLKLLGVESIVFYVAHYPVMVIASNVAQRDIGEPTLLLIIVLISGFAVPWVLTLLISHVPVSRWLFQFAPSLLSTRHVVRESF